MPPVTVKVTDELVVELDFELDGDKKHLPATAANLTSISRIYRGLIEDGEVAPASWIAKQLDVPHFTVARLIAEAKKQGLTF